MKSKRKMKYEPRLEMIELSLYSYKSMHTELGIIFSCVSELVQLHCAWLCQIVACSVICDPRALPWSVNYVLQFWPGLLISHASLPQASLSQ